MMIPLGFPGSDGYVTIFCHRNPDPDTIGCGLALAHVLSRRFDKVQVIVPDAGRYDDTNMSVLPGWTDYVVTPEEANGHISVSYSVDASSLDQLGDVVNDRFGRPDYVIDHHASNPGFAGVKNIIDSGAKSCAVVMNDVFRAVGVGLDYNTAVCLWAGLVTDTVNFAFAGPSEFRLAAELSTIVTDSEEWTRILTASHPRGWLTLVQRATAAARIDDSIFDGHGAVILPIDRSMTAGVPNGLMHTVTNLIRQVEGPVATIVMIQIGSDSWKLSIRSDDPELVDASRLAVAFGGGGHRAAAGCTMKGTPESIIADLAGSFQDTQ